MKRFLQNIRKKMKSPEAGTDEEGDVEFVELDTSTSEDVRTKLIIRPFIIEDFEDIKPILNSLREGYTVALINIKPLKDKDMIELKRAVSKLKKTCDAIEGDIAGFGDDWIVISPSFGEIYRNKQTDQISN